MTERTPAEIAKGLSPAQRRELLAIRRSPINRSDATRIALWRAKLIGWDGGAFVITDLGDEVAAILAAGEREGGET